MTTFTELYGRPHEGEWAAPGRVNLIGEHTDYNGGFVLPIALPHTTRVQARHRNDGVLRLWSARAGLPVTELRIADLAPRTVHGWAGYPAGMVWTLREAGHRVGGADLRLDSDVPTGAGLSSSAALECAVAAAYNDLYGLGLSAPDLALLAQRAENAFVGVPCGIMDQMASLCCRDGSALLLDTRDLTQRQVSFDLAAAGLELLVVDTRVKHDLGDGAYARLRAACERAAALLGLPALRDLAAGNLADALRELPGRLRPLVRHVVTEDARVRQAVALLDAGELVDLGPVLTAGHASLRDDLRVSCAETDLAVEAALAAGAHGARMTGGGFGGSVIALADAESVEFVAAEVRAAFARHAYAQPRTFTVAPSAGTRRLAAAEV